jgi:PilZ domain
MKPMSAALSLDMTTIHTQKLVLPVRYEAAGAVVQTSSTAVSSHAIHIRALRPPRLRVPVALTLYFAETHEQLARTGLVSWLTAGSNAGFWVEFNDDISPYKMSALIAKHRLNGDRACPRFPTHLEATVHQRGRGACSAQVANISRSGAFIKMQQTPTYGSVVDLDLELPGQPLPDTVDAAVVHVNPGQGVGVQFIGASDTFGAHLDEYLARLASTPRQQLQR